MKRILALIVLVNVIIGIIIAGLFYLSETYPFHPGDTLFGLQSTAEKWRLQLSSRGEKQTLMAINLADRRLADLAQADSHEKVDAAILAFNEALDRAVTYVSNMEQSPEFQLATLPPLNLLLEQARIVLYSIEKLDQCELATNLRSKIDTLITQRAPVNTDVVNNENHGGPLVVGSELISFLGQEIDHSVYPLRGKHIDSNCQNCHLTGEYVNTPTECQECHPYQTVQTAAESIYLIGISSNDFTSPANLYPNHFEGSCDECHDEASWVPISFDHREIFECRSCHVDDVPDTESEFYDIHNVYSSLCLECHKDTESWNEIEYGHGNVKECLSCHEMEEPENHYTNSACVQCHADISDWNIFEFDHTGYTDCQTCHRTPANHYLGTCATCHRNTDSFYKYNFYHMGLTDCDSCHTAPIGHYEGQCSSCHNLVAWLPANFRHLNYSVYRCSTCHQNDAPAGHYCEDCCRCHNITRWSDYTFDHTNYTDCVSCHSAPSNHYGDSCSRCHNTSDWSNYSFDHTGFVDCVSCHTSSSDHYPGQCSKCHTTSNWHEINFVHSSGDTNCTGCHQDQDPSGHFPGQCGNCHTPGTTWSNISFDHQSYRDCRACHSDDRPGAPHPSSGQCSQCHNTNSWRAPTATPTFTPTQTQTETPTFTFTPTDTYTPTPTSTGSITPVPTDTDTPVPSDTPEPTATYTNTPVPTDTPEPTATPTPPPNHYIGPCSNCHNW